MTVLEAVRAFCFQYGFEKTYWVAYSGGLDSHLLLSLCNTLRSTFPIKLRAIHVNHGLSPHATTWARHCARVCREYEIDYFERTIQIELNQGKSPEEAAREKRYAVFADCLNKGDILLTAHQQDDQVETVLLQLLRGAGPKGLAAMPSIKPFVDGFHGRPLLAFPRAVLQQYADEHQLKWIDDESNRNINLTRNFIRHTILPLLKTRWPTVTATISRSAAHCAESQVLLEAFAAETYLKTAGSRADTLSVKKLLQLDVARRKLILRTWIQQLSYPMPDARKMEAILHHVLNAAQDRSPCVKWGEVALRRYRDDLYLVPSSAPLPRCSPASLLNFSQVDAREIAVRFRQGGERINIAGRGHRTLKKLFQEWGVPPWERDHIPLIYAGEKLIGVLGYVLNEEDEKSA